MGMESEDFPEDWRIIGRRNVYLANDPAENVAVFEFDQNFIIVELDFAQIGQFGIGEAAHEKVHLTHTAMPGMEQGPAAAEVETGAGNRCARHKGFQNEAAGSFAPQTRYKFIS